MFVDASAIIAILAREADAATLTERLSRAERVRTSPVAVFEAILGLARIGNLPIVDAEEILDKFLEEIGAEIIPITDAIGRDALKAFDRFGRGKHRASLNMGDCFAYAAARHLDAPLLFKGNDFSKTDIEAA